MKITILDDDTLQVRFLKKMIDSVSKSYEISTFENPIEAANALKDSLPNLLFLDINMPLMNGWEFLDILKSEYNDLDMKLSVYIVTSAKDINHQKLEKYPVVKDIIKKPISKEVILETLQGVLT